METTNMKAYGDALRIAALSVTGELKLFNKIYGNSLPGDYDSTHWLPDSMEKEKAPED